MKTITTSSGSEIIFNPDAKVFSTWTVRDGIPHRVRFGKAVTVDGKDYFRQTSYDLHYGPEALRAIADLIDGDGQ